MPLSDRASFALGVALYGLSALYAIFLLRRGFREDNRINYLLLLAGALFHTLALFQRGFSLNRCPIHNLYEATIFFTWTTALAYLAVGAWSRLRFLGAFVSPVLFAIGVFALMPALDPPHGDQPVFTGGWLSLHASLILLAYGAFGLGAVAAIMYLTQEHNLKFNKRMAVSSLMPPIQRLERATSGLLLGGFVLLTAGLGCGVVYLKQTFGVFYLEDTKILWSVIVWAVCLTLLVSRWRFAQRGRRLAWGAVGIFLFVLLTFWGSNLLSGLHNPKAGPSPGRERPPGQPAPRNRLGHAWRSEAGVASAVSRLTHHASRASSCPARSS